VSGAADTSFKAAAGAVSAWAVPLFFLACAGLCFCLPLSNPDIFWHLSAARWIFEHAAFPRQDWLSWSMGGAPWADFEWLSQIIFFGLYKLGGFHALWFLKILLHAFAAGLLWICLGLYGAGPFARSLGIFAWALGIAPSCDLRPENFSLIFFLGLWTWLESRRMRKEVACRHEAGLFGLPLLFILWSNLHAGFPYGLLLLGIYGLGELRRKRSWTLLAACALAIPAALAHPCGADVYRVLLSHWTDLGLLQEHIREWQPPFVTDSWQWPFWGVLLAAYGGALAACLRSRRPPFEHLAALCVFGLSAGGHARTTVYLVSVGIPIITASFQDLRERRWVGRSLAVLACAQTVFFLGKAVPWITYGPKNVFFGRYAPVGLAVFLKDEQEALAKLWMTNPWHWGGYLGWRLGPRYQVSVDGRYIFHPMLRSLEEANNSPEKFQRWADGCGAQLVLLERTAQFYPIADIDRKGKRGISWRPFYHLFLPARTWALVYWDDQALAFVRRSAVSASWLREKEFTLFRPDDLTALSSLLAQGRADRARVLREIDLYARWGGSAQAQAAKIWLQSVRRPR
jgi:hypothetical protein